MLQPGCPDPVSPTVAPCPPSARPTPRWLRRAYAATAGTLYVPPLTSRAQTMRAILLAKAVVTSMRGLRASIRASHEPAAAPRRELPRVSRRLQLLRGWSHDEASSPVFPRGPCPRGSDGPGPPRRARLAVGSDPLDCREDRLLGRDAASLGAAGRA